MIRIFLVALGLMIAGPALADDLLDAPHCDARGVLAQVAEKERYRGQEPYQHTVDVIDFDHIAQTRHVHSPGPGLRDRRWCQARAHLASGHTRSVYYLIESRASFVGIAYGVESCMSGRDLWNVHGGDCSALRIW